MGEEEHEGEGEEVEQWGERAEASRSRGHQGVLECIARQRVDFSSKHSYTFLLMSTLFHPQVHLPYTLRQTDVYCMYRECDMGMLSND